MARAKKGKVAKKAKDSIKPIVVLYSGRFKRRVKSYCGQDRAALATIEEEVNTILENPLIGEPKKGKLKGIRVHKFKWELDKILLAYRFDKKARTVELLDLGTHENFYRDLEKYV